MGTKKESYIEAYGRLLKTESNYLLYSFLHFFFSALGQTFLIGIFKPFFIASIPYFAQMETTAAKDEFSTIYMFCTVISGLIIFFTGPILDRTKIRYFSLANGILLICFAVLISRSQHIVGFIIGLFGVRFCGQGMMPLIGATGTARYFNKDRGKALALSNSGIALSEAIMASVVAYMLRHDVDWRTIWQLLGILILFIFIPAIIFLVKQNSSYQSAPGARTKKGKSSVGRSVVLSEGRFYMLVFTYVFPAFLFTGVFFNREMIEQLKNYEPQWLAYALTGYGSFRFFSSLIVGPLIDKYGATRIFPFGLIPLIVGVTLLWLVDHPSAAFVFTTLAGATMSFNGLSSSAMWPEIYGTRYLGAIKSINTTFMILATAAAVKIFTWSLLSFEGLEYTLVPCIILMIILTIGSFIVTRNSKIIR